MIETGRQYFSSQHLTDINIMSTVGFDDDDIKDIYALESAEQVMPGYMADLIISQDKTDSVVRVYSVPEKSDTNKIKLNEPVLVDGRMPQNEGECVIENYFLALSGYKLGDTVKFNSTVEGNATSDYVKHLEYKIVGIIDSPMYLTYARGNSTVGDGSITFYMMIPSDEFAYERYTNVYVRTKASVNGYSDFSDEYKDMVADEKEEFEGISDKCIDRFNKTVLADSKKELSDAKKEYADKKQETFDKMSDGASKLHKGEEEYNNQIADAQRKLDEAEAKLEEGKKKLEQGQKDYKDGIEEARNKLSDAQTQYSDGLKKYNDAKLEYDTKIREAENQLNSAQKEFDTQYQLFYFTTKPQAENKLALLKAGINLCDEIISRSQQRLDEIKHDGIIGEALSDEVSSLESKLDEYSEKLSEYQLRYDEGTNQLAEGERQLNEAKAKLDAAVLELETQKTNGAVQLNDAKNQLDSAESQLETGKLEYETAMTTGLLDLQTAQAEITEGEKQLSDGKTDFENQKLLGLQKLKKSREQLEKGRYDAYIQLSEAEEKLNDAQEKLDKLDEAKWIVNDRDSNPGYSGLVDDANRVDSIARVFPIFFLLVAALVCLTTMTRMVEERRTEIGTLKALGYSNAAIASKYFIYSGTAALSGSIVGSVIGVFTLPYIIVQTYGIMYTLPATKLVVSWSSLLASSIIGVFCICIVSLAACYHDLKIAPAILMRPKAPKPGKRILLEHIRPIWKHMNFTSKVTARNLFRYKARFLMTVIGVAGCTALIVAAFGLRDSITDIADKQFKGVTSYDQVYALSESQSADKKAYLMSQIHADERIENAALGYIGWSKACSENHKEMIVGRTLIFANDDYKTMFKLRDRKSGEEYTLGNEGIIINERLGDVLRVRQGDSITLNLEDNNYICKITALTENYSGNFFYMTPEYYRELTGNDPKYGVVFTHISEEYKSEENEIANDWMKNEDIMTVSSTTEQVNAILDMLQSLNVIIFVMVFCAGLLAVVVLYNLTNINIAERVREIATIKVLGFYSLETANFIYRENIVLTAVGAFVGLFLGNMLSVFIVDAIQMDNVMFPKVITPLTYFLGFILTFLFSMFVNFIMYFKMNKISMVESLKSIE